MPTRIWLISDTHGLLRPEAIAFLRDCAHIIHGGDIGGPDILDALRHIAPLTVVRGNNDGGDWAQAIRQTETFEADGVRIYVIHDLKGLECEPGAQGIRVVVSGHSHRPSVAERDGVWFVNPGSAGPRRFKLPVAVGELTIDGERVSARIMPLSTGSTVSPPVS